MTVTHLKCAKKINRLYYDNLSLEGIEHDVVGRRRYISRRIHNLLDLMGLTKGDLLLDIGSGVGIGLLRLALQGFQVTGVDISSRMIRLAREKIEKNGLDSTVSFVVADAENLPFKENTFNGVICLATLHHLPSPAKGIKEFARVSKPKGRIGVSEPNPLNPYVAYRGIINRMKKNEEVNILGCRRGLLKSFFKGAGVKNIRIKHILFTPRGDNSLVVALSRLEPFVEKIPVLQQFSACLNIVGEKKK